MLNRTSVLVVGRLLLHGLHAYRPVPVRVVHSVGVGALLVHHVVPLASAHAVCLVREMIPLL